MIGSSLSKAVRAAHAKPFTSVSSSSISTNAAIRPYLSAALVEDFRIQFWKAFAERSVGRDNFRVDDTLACRRALDDASSQMSATNPDDEKEALLRKCAREDLFKHFRMSAASRAMKRGGVMSKYFYLNQSLTQPYHDMNSPRTEIPSLIDDATARKAREDMYSHFWSSYEARKATNVPTFSSAQHLHEYRYKLPTTLNDAYLEFGSRMKEMYHSPRPMAITEIEPPFKIVDVNKAWTKLCGYTREESVGSTLKELLAGPETNMDVARSLTTSLTHLGDGDLNVEHEAVIVNYRSDSRRFRNHVRVGRIKNEVGDTTHFVGVFRKLSDDKGSEADDVYANV